LSSIIRVQTNDKAGRVHFVPGGRNTVLSQVK